MTDNIAYGSHSPLRVAIVGAGRMGMEHAATLARLADSASVVAVVDPDERARDRMQRLVPSARSFVTADALFSDRSACPEVVHVCTAPPETHEVIARRALEAGCHIYVEKPFSDTMETAGEILALAHAASLKVCAGHQLLFHDVALRTTRLLESLGTIVHVESYFAFKPIRTDADGGRRISTEEQLFDVLPHPTCLLLDFLQRVEPAHAMELETLEVGKAGTVHAVLRRGSLRGVLCVTVTGRPVESIVRIVGSNGRLQADFMRGTLQRLLGPGTSVIDKSLDPFRWSWQMAGGTARALAARAVGRDGGYGGLKRIFEEFYRSILENKPCPVSPESLMETSKVGDALREALDRVRPNPVVTPAESNRSRLIAVTGGTGFLGRRVVSELVSRGYRVRALARHLPPAWEAQPGVEYVACDLGEPMAGNTLDECVFVIHCAAETSGGREAHQRNSVDATRHVLLASAEAGVGQFLHVSSLAVLARPVDQEDLDESSPLRSDTQSAGAYVWGKTVAERLATDLGQELGIRVKIVRPGPMLDGDSFEPPGRLGRRIGSWFVAMGSAREVLGTVDVRFAARTLAWIVENFERAPRVIHALSPKPLTRRELLERLKSSPRPARVIWVPRPVLVTFSVLARLLQRVMLPSRPAIDLRDAFSSPRYNTELIGTLENSIREDLGQSRSMSIADVSGR